MWRPRTIWIHLLVVVAVLALRLSVAAQSSNERYTFRHGYDPGYYATRVPPRDPGDKPGQLVPSGNTIYWPIHGASTSPQTPRSPPQRAVRVTQLPRREGEEPRNDVLLVAHVPDDAGIWIEGEPTTAKGTVRLFESPALEPGKKYRYSIRLAWAENGRKVSQAGVVPVHAGEVHCLDLVSLDHVSARIKDEQKIGEALSGLNAEDRALVTAQRFCAVQNETRLGTKGTPVKIVLEGKPVFLCCEACRRVAEKDAKETLKKVEALKATQVAPTRRQE